MRAIAPSTRAWIQPAPALAPWQAAAVTRRNARCLGRGSWQQVSRGLSRNRTLAEASRRLSGPPRRVHTYNLGRILTQGAGLAEMCAIRTPQRHGTNRMCTYGERELVTKVACVIREAGGSPGKNPLFI